MTLRHVTCARLPRRTTGILVAFLLTTTAVEAAPAIRMNAQNRVPVCATPDRLMTFLADRNEGLNPRYRDIAKWYRHYGEAWGVRWDYAFFQMILETNYLKYRRGDGRRGDVREHQNNFAGIGATGGGVPGERFADIKTGVHAQIQHLVAYSGERVAEPVAKRTRENQDDIIDKSRRLRRPVTFGDLARRWAADRAYARSIDTVASLFREGYCKPETVTDRAPPPPQPVLRKTSFNYPPPSRLGGPEERMKLAGPDDLPWASGAAAGEKAKGAPEAQTVQSPSVSQDKEPAKKSKSPVRTIWSREGGADLDTVAGAPQPAQAPAAVPEAPAAAVVEAAPTAEAPAEDGGFLLGKFKIPSAPVEPSKLGGPVDPAAAVAPAARPALAPPPAAASDANCLVQAASYGGSKTLLLRDETDGKTRLTALTVLDGFEKSMVDTFAKANAIKVDVIGEYETKDKALADANANCSGSE